MHSPSQRSQNATLIDVEGIEERGIQGCAPGDDERLGEDHEIR